MGGRGKGRRKGRMKVKRVEEERRLERERKGSEAETKDRLVWIVVGRTI